MGRNATITQQEVDAACIKIIKEGNLPTVQRLRLELGRGNSTTINSMLKEFKRQQETFVPISKRSAEIESAFNQFVAAVELEYTEKIDKLESIIRDQKSEILVYLEESEKYLSELEGLKKAYKKTADKISRLESSLENRDLLLREERLKNESLLQKTAELEGIKIMNRNLTAENEQLKTNLNSYLERAVAAEKELELVRK